MGGSEVDYFMPSFFHIDILSGRHRGPVFSVFNNSFVEKDQTIKMDYTGPKYLLEEDKDFYINEVKCPLQQNKRWEEGRKATYYLHFNPKNNILLFIQRKLI